MSGHGRGICIAKNLYSRRNTVLVIRAEAILGWQKSGSEIARISVQYNIEAHQTRQSFRAMHFE